MDSGCSKQHEVNGVWDERLGISSHIAVYTYLQSSMHEYRCCDTSLANYHRYENGEP